MTHLDIVLVVSAVDMLLLDARLDVDCALSVHSPLADLEKHLPLGGRGHCTSSMVVTDTP